MIGIVGCSVYIPRYRVGPLPCGAFDEDSLTMGQSAAWGALNGEAPDRLYFASTSSPYWQRSVSSQIAAACDLPAGTATMDFAGSLRSGTSALIAAFDAVQAGSASTVLVVASDQREGEGEERALSDAAAAVSIGHDELLAELVGCISRSDNFLDEWRRDLDNQVRSYASKYSTARGYEANTIAACRMLLRQSGITPGENLWAALPAPDEKALASCGRALSLAGGKAIPVSDGRCGAAMPLVLLARALEVAKSGDLVLCAGYGEGADALLFRMLRDGTVWKADSRTSLYRKSRATAERQPQGAEISNVFWEREESQNVRLHGTKCPKCTLIQFPIARVCGRCRNMEGLLEQPLGRTGRLFTYTKDFLYDAPVQPTVMSVIDLDGGGRFLCQMTDMDESEVKIGMPVELVLRRMREASGNHQYYWKCRPE